MPKKKLSPTFRGIDRHGAYALGKLFMLCYKRGVNDAFMHSHDEGALREHFDLTSDCRTFGFVGDASDRWVYFRNRLMDMADAENMYNPIDRTFGRMRKYRSNYLSVALVVAQSFYNRGITDYIDNPDVEILSQYNDGNLRWWGSKSKKKIDGYRLRAYVQDVCARYISKIEDGEENPLPEKFYDVFMQVFSFAIVAKQ